jgi:hypothetical protein
MIRKSLIALGLAFAVHAPAFAAPPAPASAPSRGAAPASAPSTTTAPAHHALVIPPGFKKITVNQRMALVEPADEAWVSQTLEAVQPTTMPTTMPSDLLGQIKASRAQLRARVMKDLAISDPAVVDKFFSEKLEPLLQRFDDINPPLYYLVTSREKLKELLKAGWSDPRFYYNRVADNVQFSPAINLTTEGEADDVVLPAVFDATDPPDKKRESLTKLVHDAEAGVANSVSGRAMSVMQLAFVDFIYVEAIKPMNVNTQTEWFGLGLSGIVSSRYVSQITGINLDLFLQNMTTDNPGNPIRSTTIDLLHPTPQTEMRPMAAPAYADAYRRKAARVVALWTKKAGDDAIPKTIAALKQSKPADGETLVKQIQQASGVDLSQDVKPGK